MSPQVGREERQAQPAGQGWDDFPVSTRRVWHPGANQAFHCETPRGSMKTIETSNPQGQSGVFVSRLFPNQGAQTRCFKTTETHPVTVPEARRLQSGGREGGMSPETPGKILPGPRRGHQFLGFRGLPCGHMVLPEVSVSGSPVLVRTQAHWIKGLPTAIGPHLNPLPSIKIQFPNQAAFTHTRGSDFNVSFGEHSPTYRGVSGNSPGLGAVVK